MYEILENYGHKLIDFVSRGKCHIKCPSSYCHKIIDKIEIEKISYHIITSTAMSFKISVMHLEI